MSIANPYRAVLSVILACAAFAVAGCGSSSKSAQTMTTADWADGVCSAVTTYRGSLTDAVNSVKSNPSKAGLQDAADATKSATDTFVSDVKGLGKPNTNAGQQAKDTIDTLSNSLGEDVSAIQDAAGTGGLQGVSVVTGTLATAKTQVTTAVKSLEGLDAKGELTNAFSKAPSCASMSSS
jgi:hypothetical protein